MHGNSIGIDNLLENFSKLIRFDVSGRLDGVIFKSLQIGWSESSQVRSKLLFFLARAPEIADVHSFALLHQVNAAIDRSFFGNKPFVDLKTACRLLSTRDLTYLNKVFLKLLFGLHSQIMRFHNVSFDFLNLLINLRKRRQIKSLSHKRVADSGNFFSHRTTILKDYNENGLLFDNESLIEDALLNRKFLEVGCGFTSGRSEQEFF